MNYSSYDPYYFVDAGGHVVDAGGHVVGIDWSAPLQSAQHWGEQLGHGIAQLGELGQLSQPAPGGILGTAPAKASAAADQINRTATAAQHHLDMLSRSAHASIASVDAAAAQADKTGKAVESTANTIKVVAVVVGVLGALALVSSMLGGHKD